MAGAFVQEVSAGTIETPPSATLIIPVNNDCSSSDTLMLVVGYRDDTAVIDTITDSRGNVWESDIVSPEANGSNSSITCSHGYMGTTPLQAGDTIQVTFSGPIGDARIYYLWEFQGIVEPLTAFATSGVVDDNGSDATPTVTASTPTPQADAVAITAWITNDVGNVITQDGNYNSGPTGQITTASSPSNRTAIAGYRILSAAATESCTISLGSGATNIAGLIAVYRAAPDTPSSPVASTYGVVYSADGLANLEMGHFVGRRPAIRWRADYSGVLNSVVIYHKTGVGYSAGNGGSVRCDLMSDDGSASHFPSGTVLATSGSLVTPNADDAFRYTFTSPPTIVEGVIYHFVFTNTGVSPTINYVSMDDIYQNKQTSPVLPTIPDNDLAVLFQSSGPPWVINLGHTPIFAAEFADGRCKGQSYIDALSQSGAREIKGANSAVRMFFTPTQSFTVSKIWARVYKIAGETQALSFLLKNQAGTTLQSGTVPAASIAAGTLGSGNALWYGVTITPQLLAAGSTYRLELWCTAGANGFVTFPIQGGPGSGNYARFNSDNVFDDGWFEYTINAGGAWNQHSGSTAFKLQAYFEVAAVSPPGGIAHGGRALLGAGL